MNALLGDVFAVHKEILAKADNDFASWVYADYFYTYRYHFTKNLNIKSIRLINSFILYLYFSNTTISKIHEDINQCILKSDFSNY